MNGLRRIATAIRVLGWFPLAFALVTAFHPSMSGEAGWMRAAIVLVGGGLPLGIAYVLAWIIDGFARPRD